MYSMPLSLHHSMHECRLSSSDSWSSPPSSFEPSVCSMPKSMYSGCGSLEDSPRFCKRRRYSVWPKCEGTRSALLPTHINMSKVFSSIPETHSWISSNDVDCQEHRYQAKYTILRIHCEDKCYTQHQTLHFCKNRLGIDSICYFLKITKGCTKNWLSNMRLKSCLVLTLLRSKTMTRASQPFTKDCNCCPSLGSGLLRHVIQTQTSAV